MRQRIELIALLALLMKLGIPAALADSSEYGSWGPPPVGNCQWDGWHNTSEAKVRDLNGGCNRLRVDTGVYNGQYWITDSAQCTGNCPSIALGWDYG